MARVNSATEAAPHPHCFAQGVTTGGRALFAGMSAGLLEALLVSVPAETLKTRRLASGLSYSALMQHGLRGVYAGVLPTILRQGLHGAVRFGSYSSMKNFVQGSTRPGQALPGGITFALGAVAGLITVCESGRRLPMCCASAFVRS